MALESSNDCDDIHECLCLLMFTLCNVWEKEGVSEELTWNIQGLSVYANEKYLDLCLAQREKEPEECLKCEIPKQPLQFDTSSVDAFMKHVLKYQNRVRVLQGKGPILETITVLRKRWIA